MKDLYNNVKEVTTKLAAVFTATENFVSVDHTNFNGVDQVINVGQSGDTLSGSVYIELILEDSDDNSVWTPVTDNDCVLGPQVDSNGVFDLIDDAAEDEKTISIGYRGIKRYSRVVAQFTGTHTNGTPLAGVAVLGLPEYASTR